MDFAFLFGHGSIPTGPSNIHKAADVVFARIMLGRDRRVGGLVMSEHNGNRDRTIVGTSI